MVMVNQAKYLYEFGPFAMDTVERVLFRDGHPVPLTPKVFDLLMALVENRGHVVEKEDLMQRLWPETIVEEANLPNNISLLRKALGDDTTEHQYVETVPRRGYRFVAEVSVLLDESPELVIEERRRATLMLEEIGDPTSAERRKRLMRLPLMAVGVVLALAVYAIWPKSAAPLQSIRSLAVLPFKPLVADSRDEALELGMAEALITRLSSITEIGVRPVSAVRRYSSLEQDLITAGQEQKVDAVLEGNLQTTGERVRVTVRLVNVSDAQTLWTDKFDAPLADLFTLQDAISEKVATALAVELTGDERQSVTRYSTDNPEAYQLYLKGRIFRHQWTEESIQKALACFDKAIAIDPNYALAYAGKADVYSVNSSVLLPPAEAMPKAREAALKALALDDQLAEVHFSMARIKQWADWDWAGAESEFKRALELKPNDTEIRGGYKEFLIRQKRFDEALKEAEREQEIDPVSFAVNFRLARLFYLARQYEQSLAQARELAALYPNYDAAHMMLGSVLTQKGMYEEASNELRKAIDLHRTDANLSQFGYICALTGRREEARSLLQELGDRAKQRYVSPVGIARIYVGLGEKERVFEWLRKGYEDRSDHLLWLGVDPSFDAVRTDPRFENLLRLMNLAS